VIVTTLPCLRHASSATVAISSPALAEIERSLTSVWALLAQGRNGSAIAKKILP
jgi:hypothetical protein